MGNRLQKLREEMSSVRLRPGSRAEKKEDNKENNVTEVNTKVENNTDADARPAPNQVRKS
jgi:hypothetical protein